MPCRRGAHSVSGCKIALVAGCALTVVLSSSGITIWIANYEDVAKTDELRHNQLTLNCIACFSIYATAKTTDLKCKSIKDKCRTAGWEHRVQLPSSCEKNEKILQLSKRIVRDEFREEKQKFADKKISDVQRKCLISAETSFYATGDRLILHWSPWVSTKPDANGWSTVHKYVRNSSCFSMSEGPESAHRNGSVYIAEKDFYFVYAKLTFACQDVSVTEKRVGMKVTTSNTSHPHLLQDLQTATCRQKGDLVTLYQSGVFELFENEMITLKYHAPSDVVLSSTNRFFKSVFGMVALGHSQVGA